jgi:TRAP-type mannitol/chloroaromatic compound transport system permease large subunit
MVSLILVGLLAVLLTVNVSVAVAFGLTSAAFLLLVTDIPLVLIPQQMFAGTDSTVLQAVPFFLLAGALMDKGGISRRLITFANVLVGWATGGLAMVSVVASMFFAGISGSAAADSAAVGSVMIPAIAAPEWNHRQWDPLWSAVEEAELPVVIHQGTGHSMYFYRGPGAGVSNLLATQSMAPA